MPHPRKRNTAYYSFIDMAFPAISETVTFHIGSSHPANKLFNRFPEMEPFHAIFLCKTGSRMQP